MITQNKLNMIKIIFPKKSCICIYAHASYIGIIDAFFAWRIVKSLNLIQFNFLGFFLLENMPKSH